MSRAVVTDEEQVHVIMVDGKLRTIRVRLSERNKRELARLTREQATEGRWMSWGRS